DFREFWMRKPNPTDDFLKFYALLDSESLTGGYEFVVQYGAITTMDIKPTLKPDYQPTGKIEFSMNKTDFHRREFRPQVHDSDGLLLDTSSGEKLWAPLNNPRSVSVRLFSNVLSYSMVQRGRNLND